MKPRTVQPELLDSLPPDSPIAAHNRRDLRITNRVLRNYPWFASTLRPLMPPFLRPDAKPCALELGAGIGELLAHLRDHNIVADGLDLWPRPATLPATQRWHRADLREFNAFADYPIVFGNFIFHQFSAEELSALGAKLARTAHVIVTCEPARRRSAQLLFSLIAPLFGAHPVTLHDGRVSIAAGFLGDELPHALGLDPARWSWRCTTTLLGINRVVATRRA